MMMAYDSCYTPTLGLMPYVRLSPSCLLALLACTLHWLSAAGHIVPGLQALMKVDPSNTLIPKIVKGLLASRKQGHWNSTQANCWVLLALANYFEKYEALTPQFDAKLWLGEAFVGGQTFQG